MKRNVDLSERRMFTTPGKPTGLAKVFYDALEAIKPWDFDNKPKECLSDLDFQIVNESKSFFVVGNKKDRRNWKRNHEYDTEQICYCCGQNIGKKPWANVRCNCYSMNYTTKIPWKF